MKKILLTLALAAFAFTANAQFVIGGNFDVNHNGQMTGDYGDWSNTTLSFMPKVGYWLNDNMQVGMQFGVDYTYGRTYAGDNNNDHYLSTTQFEWNFLPYFRYNLATWKNFTVFCEAQLGIGITPKGSWKNTVANTSGDGATSAFELDLYVTPGLNYALTDKLSLDVYINLLGLYYEHTRTTTATAAGDVDVYNNNYGFRANMNDQTVFAHLNNFSIGFNYAF